MFHMMVLKERKKCFSCNGHESRVASSQGIVGNFVGSQGILGFFGRSGKSQGILSHGIFKFYKYQCLSISDAYNFFFFQFMSVKSN